jgi:hypothetical protein
MHLKCKDHPKHIQRENPDRVAANAPCTLASVSPWLVNLPKWFQPWYGGEIMYGCHKWSACAMERGQHQGQPHHVIAYVRVYSSLHNVKLSCSQLLSCRDFNNDISATPPIATARRLNIICNLPLFEGN